MGIIDQIQQREDFTETEQEVIRYLMQNSGAMEQLTIRKVAEDTYSSNASVIRFCRKLGYQGFRAFKVAFVRELESRKYIVNDIDYSRPFNSQAPTAAIVNSIYSLHRESMDLMQSKLDIRALEQMVSCLLKSERIFLFGISDRKIALHSFMNRLLKIGFFPIMATENNEEGHTCSYITSKDCALFVTYSGAHFSYRNCVKKLKKNHVPILLLTANPDCEVYRYSSFCICIPDLESKDNIATYYSQFAFEYLLNLIYSLMYRESKKQ